MNGQAAPFPILPHDLAEIALRDLPGVTSNRGMDRLAGKLALRLLLRPVDLAATARREARIPEEQLLRLIKAHPSQDPEELIQAFAMMRLQTINLLARTALAKAGLFISFAAFAMILAGFLTGMPQFTFLSYMLIAASLALSLRRKIFSPDTLWT